MGAVWAAQAPAAARQARGDQGAARRRGGRSRVAMRASGARRRSRRASAIPTSSTVHDFNTLPSGTPYLVLEYLEGEDLAQRLARGTMPLEPALAIARQIGSRAARGAQGRRRAPRSQAGQHLPGADGDRRRARRSGEGARLRHLEDSRLADGADAGVGAAGDAAVHGAGAGARQEHARSTRAPTSSRSGAIVYEMLSGKAAFMGDDAGGGGVQGRVRQAAAARGDASRGCRRTCADAVEQALEKDVDARFADVGAFINALTGRPLQTLDRARAKNPAPEAFASTQAAGASQAAVSPPSTGARGEMTPSIPIPPTTGPAAKSSDGKKAAFIVGALLGRDRRHRGGHEADVEAAAGGAGAGRGDGAGQGGDAARRARRVRAAAAAAAAQKR